MAWNGYAAMALPGSGLYRNARKKGYQLPDNYSGYSFYAYDTLPLPTEELSPSDILEFRDQAFMSYHTHPLFLEKIRQRFGPVAVENIEKLTSVKLRRRLLGHSK